MTPTKPEDALVAELLRLKAFLEAHHCNGDAITTLLERVGKLEELLWRAMDDASISPDTWYAEARAALTGDGV